MNLVKTTSLPNQKNRTVYFEVDEEIRYYEEKTGTKVSEDCVEFIKTCSYLINKAYRDGYKDGKEAAAV